MLQKRDGLVELYVLIADALVLAISYIGGLFLYQLTFHGESSNDLPALLVTAGAFLVMELFFSTNKYIVKRDRTEEFAAVLKQSVLFLMMVALIAVLFHSANLMSRMVLGYTVALYFILDFLAHLLLKSLFRKKGGKRNLLLVVTTKDNADEVILQASSGNLDSEIFGVAIVDSEMKGETIREVPVVADRNDMFEYAKKQVVDQVLLYVPSDFDLNIADAVREFESMGIVVHVAFPELEAIDEHVRSVSNVGNYQVMTFSQNVQDVSKAFVKRCIDILAGIVGCIICLILTIFVGPAIFIESPGPIFFKQKRVGRNGRFFYMYKFRSMYRDAEARKAELMAQNEMNGLMFKVTDDPRITKVGKFIRKTSIDEFPQFFNILKGDMSLIGTRPPTLDEFKKYEEHHKSRLAMKPGLTGMWQASGRSDISDFEEVVRLDCYYIDNWSLMLDLKIFFKTIVSVLGRKGSR